MSHKDPLIWGYCIANCDSFCASVVIERGPGVGFNGSMHGFKRRRERKVIEKKRGNKRIGELIFHTVAKGGKCTGTLKSVVTVLKFGARVNFILFLLQKIKELRNYDRDRNAIHIKTDLSACEGLLLYQEHLSKHLT